MKLTAADKFAVDLELREKSDPSRAEAYLAAGVLTIRVPLAGMALPGAA